MRRRYYRRVILSVIFLILLLIFSWWVAGLYYVPHPPVQTSTAGYWPTRVTATVCAEPSATLTQVASPTVTPTCTIMYTITEQYLTPTFTVTVTPTATRYYVTATPDKYPICTSWGIRWVTWERWEKMMGWKTCPEWYTTTTKIAR